MKATSDSSGSPDLRDLANELCSTPSLATHPRGWFDRLLWRLVGPLWMRAFHPFFERQNVLLELVTARVVAMTDAFPSFRVREDALEASVRECGERIRSLTGDKDRVLEHLAGLQEAYDQVVRSMAEGQDLLSRDRNAIVKHLGGLQIAMERLDARMDSVVGDKEAIEVHVHGLQDALEAGRAQSEGVDGRIADLIRDKEAIEVHLNDLQSALEAHGGRIGLLATEKELIEDHITRLQAAYEQLAVQASELTANARALDHLNQMVLDIGVNQTELAALVGSRTDDSGAS